jgi:hypothetical protein
MNQPVPGIASILDDLGLVDRDTSLVTIGSADISVPHANIVEAYDALSGPDDLPKNLRAALGIVVTPLDFMARSAAEQLLSRLRDIHCEKVVLIDTNGGWTSEELRALGYLEVGQPTADLRCYLFDPDAFNQPREWNNPSDWANPQNFRKYRW